MLKLSFSQPIHAFLIIKGAVYAKKNNTINIDKTITIIPNVCITPYNYKSFSYKSSS